MSEIYKEKGEEAFEEYVDNLKECRLQLSKMKSLRMLGKNLEILILLLIFPSL